jgi:hypothetical protein
VNELRRAALPCLVLTGLLGIDIVFRPLSFGLAFRAWLVALGALAAAAMVRASLAPYRQVHVKPVRFRRPRHVTAERPAGLEEVERAIDFALWNAADLNRRLRPMLREVAAHRLLSRRGVDIDRSPRAAQQLLGDVAWELVVAPTKNESEGRPSGTSPSAIRATIERLENL